MTQHGTAGSTEGKNPPTDQYLYSNRERNLQTLAPDFVAALRSINGPREETTARNIIRKTLAASLGQAE